MITHTPYHTDRDFFNTNQGGRSWQPFGEGKNGHTNLSQARIYYFRVNASFLRLRKGVKKVGMMKKGSNFCICLRSGSRGMSPPPLYSQPDRNISVLFTPCLILSWLPELRDEVEDIVGDQTNLIWWKILCAYCSLALPPITHNVSLQIMQEYKARSDLTFWVPIFLNNDSTFSSAELTRPFLLKQNPHRPTEPFR